MFLQKINSSLLYYGVYFFSQHTHTRRKFVVPGLRCLLKSACLLHSTFLTMLMFPTTGVTKRLRWRLVARKNSNSHNCIQYGRRRRTTKAATIAFHVLSQIFILFHLILCHFCDICVCCAQWQLVGLFYEQLITKKSIFGVRLNQSGSYFDRRCVVMRTTSCQSGFSK